MLPLIKLLFLFVLEQPSIGLLNRLLLSIIVATTIVIELAVVSMSRLWPTAATIAMPKL